MERRTGQSSDQSLNRYSDAHPKILAAFRDRQPLLLLLSVSLLVGTFGVSSLVKGSAIAAFGSFLSALLVSFYLATRASGSSTDSNFGSRDFIDGLLGLVFPLQLLIGFAFLAIAGIGIVVDAGVLAVLPAPFWLALFGLIGVTAWRDYKSLSGQRKSRIITMRKISAIGLLILLPAVVVNHAMSPWLLGEDIHRVVSGVLALPDIAWFTFFFIWVYGVGKGHGEGVNREGDPRSGEP